MKSKHLTMTGMYPRNNCTVVSKPPFAQLLVDRHRNIFECGKCASIELTFILLHEVDVYRMKSVSMCGLASALLSYCVVGIFVYAMMITL